MDDVMTNNFEIFVQGKTRTYLVHSRMQKNHKLFVDESKEHMDIVKQSIKDIIAGKEPTLAESRKKQEKAPKRSMEQIEAEAKAVEDEKNRKKEEAEKRKTELAKAREEAEEAKAKKIAEDEAKKKEELEKKKKEEAAKRRKRAAEMKAKKAKETPRSDTTASTTASVASIHCSEGSVDQDVELPEGKEEQNEVQAQHAAKDDLTPIEEIKAQDAPAVEAANSKAEESTAEGCEGVPRHDSLEAVAANSTALTSLTSTSIVDESSVKVQSAATAREELQTQLREREEQRAAARAKAQKEVPSSIFSLFGITCCRSSEPEESNCEAANVKLVSNDELLSVA